MRLASLGLVALGSLPFSAAVAADLPVAPEPIDYVRICDAFGSRFFYLPGTETCLRVGGRIRTEARIQNFGDTPNNWDADGDISTAFRARGYAYLDSRTTTEFGLLRTYMSLYVTNTTGSAGNDSTTLEFGYVQFGGLTAGRAQSFWDFWTGYAFGAQVDDYSDTKTNLFAYTGNFGNGLSATVALEDGTRRRNPILGFTGGVAITAGGSTNLYGGHKLPDLVAALRIEQGWGSAQVMGALHQVYVNQTAIGGLGSGELGWALGGAVEIKVPVLGKNDKFVVQAGYSDGASGFPLDSWDSRITDAIVVGNSTRTTKTWNIAGGWRHSFSNTFTGNIEGGYHSVDAGLNAYDFNQWGITGNLVWSPVSGLDIGGEIQFRNVDYNSASGLSDKNALYSTLRVQRTF